MLPGQEFETGHGTRAGAQRRGDSADGGEGAEAGASPRLASRVRLP